MRININYNLDEDVSNWVRNVNKEISLRTENEIDFADGKYRPHITLLMGEIEEKNLDKIRKLVENFKSKVLDKKIEFQSPFVKNNYIFVEVDDTNLFKQDCDEMLNLLKDLIVPHKYLISNGNIPHITLGYVKQTGGVLDAYLQSIKFVPDAILKKLSVDLAGVHGTVICE